MPISKPGMFPTYRAMVWWAVRGLVVVFGLLILVWAVVYMAGCVRIPHVEPPALPGSPSAPSAPSIVHILVPDTSETFWYLGLLAGLCFTVGVLAILASIFGRVIGFGLGGGALLRAGLCCIVAGLGMAAVQYFLRAYLGVTVFAVVILGAVALIPWVKTYFEWTRFRRGAALAHTDPRAGVAVMATVNRKVDKARKKVLAAIEGGSSVKEAVRAAV